MNHILNFLVPYAYFSTIASYGVAQNLEGLGIFKYFNDAVIWVGGRGYLQENISPVVGVSIFSELITLYLIFLSVANIRACYSVGRWLGPVSILAWIIPGSFALVGWAITPQWASPDVFRFASGYTGGVWSAAANLAIALVSGWSIAILFGARWNKNNFKNIYDHIWYPLGLMATLYFVVDTGLPFYKGDADDATKQEIVILNLYEKSAKNVQSLCGGGDEFDKNFPELCKFNEYLSREIDSDIDQRRRFKSGVDEPAWVRILLDKKYSSLMAEIDSANNSICSKKEPGGFCTSIPPEENLDPRFLNSSILFLPGIYADAVHKDELVIKKAADHVGNIEEGHNIRYFAFLVVGFLAGGKISNATRALLDDEDVAKQRSWAWMFLKFMLSAAAWIMTKFLKFLGFFIANINWICVTTRRKLRAADGASDQPRP